MGYIKTHLWYITVLAVLFVCGRAWLAEHDRNLVSQQAVADSQARVKGLEQQVKDVQASADKERANLLAQARAVKTPQQAVAAMPNVSSLPVISRPKEATVEVDAVKLYQEEASCKIARNDLAACQAVDAKKDEVLAEKEVQIKALKKGRGFFARTWSAIKIGAPIGGVLLEVARIGLTGRL